MKKYIIFGWASSIGGGQLYTDYKCQILKECGFDVYVIYASDAPIVLSNIQNAKCLLVKEISLLPSQFSKKRVSTICRKITNFIGLETNDVFFESNGVRYSYWAELISKYYNSKHFAFCLEGYFPSRDKNSDYLLFKLNRKEIAGTRETSLYRLFGGDIITKENNKFFTAFTQKSYADVPAKDRINFSKYDFVIGYIGRELKPCFSYVYREIYNFCNRHQEYSVLFFCVGGSDDSLPSIEATKLLGSLKNVDVFFTGKLFPIPTSYLNAMSICIGTSGSAKVAAVNGVKTIKLLDDGNYPIGIIGYDLKSSSSEERQYKKTLSELIDDVLFNNYCNKYTYCSPYAEIDEETRKRTLINNTFEMMNDEYPHLYFDTYKLKSKSFLRNVYYFFKRFIGK